MRCIFFIFGLLATILLQANENSSDQEVYEFMGSHFLASYSGCDETAMTNLTGLTSAMEEAAKASGATVLQTATHVFPPYGFTMVILLSESHASIHTYPEVNACFVDLFTCGTRCSAERFDEVLQSYLKPKEVNKKMLIREKDIKEK